VAAHARRGGALSRIAVSRADAIGSRAAWRPLMPVTQWAATKTDG
jgi:precorrin-6Y C5,15-methyltransferase (decarboxylating)